MVFLQVYGLRKCQHCFFWVGSTIFFFKSAGYVKCQTSNYVSKKINNLTKKFSLEFFNYGGLERLLEVTRPSIAVTGTIFLLISVGSSQVKTFLFNLNFIFQSTGVSIALYCLAYCEDTMERICSMSQKFVSEVAILGDYHNLNEGETCAARQLIRHVCVALKKYVESHLYYKYSEVSRLNTFATRCFFLQST